MQALALSIFLFGCQDPPPAIGDLINRLGSERIDERDEATQGLKRIGESVLPVLRRAARNSNPEVAGRAQYLLRVIPILNVLTPGMMKEMPGVEDRLAAGDDSIWTQIYIESLDSRRYPKLEKEDREPIALKAICAAQTPKDQVNMCESISFREHLSAIPELLNLLADKDSRVREASIKALAKMRVVNASPRIAGLATDPKIRVRMEVAKALGALGAIEQVPTLVAMLEDPDQIYVAASARGALGTLDAVEAAPDIVKLLDHKDGSIRENAVGMVGFFEIETAVPKLMELLQDPDSDVRLEAMKSLVHLRGSKAIPHIIHLMRDKDSVVVQETERAVSKLGDKSLTDELFSLLDHPRGHVRSNAVVAIGALNLPDGGTRILKILEDPDRNARQAAVYTLASLGFKAAIGDIRKRLKDEDGFVRGSAVAALGTLGDRDSLPKFRTYLTGPDDSLRGGAVRAIVLLGSTEDIQAIAKLAKDEASGERLGVVWSLGDLRTRESASCLVDIMIHDHSYISGDAAAVLRDMGRIAYEPVIAVIRDKNETHYNLALRVLKYLQIDESVNEILKVVEKEGRYQDYAMEVLGSLGAREAIPKAIEFLRDDDLDLRRSALYALADLDAKEAVPEILHLLASTNKYPKFVALETLERLGSRDHISNVTPFLEDDEFIMRTAAASTLTRWGYREAIPKLIEAGRFPEVHLWSLNAVRTPELWEVLRTRKLKHSFHGKREDLWKLIASEAGFQGEPALVHTRVGESASSTECWALRRGGMMSLLQALIESLEYQNCDFILEQGQIRIVDRMRAFRFWKTWWENQQRGER